MPSITTTKRLPRYWLAGLIFLGLSAIFVPYFILPALVAGFVLSAPWIVASIASVLASFVGLRLIYSAWSAASKQQANSLHAVNVLQKTLDRSSQHAAPIFKKIPKEVHQLTSNFLSNTESRNYALLNKFLHSSMTEPLLKQQLIKLVQAIMKGDPKTVKAITSKRPDLLFKEWHQPMTDPSGRTFAAASTAFKLILWLREPMRDEVLACIPEKHANLKTQIDKQKNEFKEKGLNYTFRDETGMIQTESESKGYSLAPTIISINNAMNDFLAVPNYQKQIRGVPYWIAQLFCNNLLPVQNSTIFNKQCFRAPVVLFFRGNKYGKPDYWFGADSKLNCDYVLCWDTERGAWTNFYHYELNWDPQLTAFTSLDEIITTDADNFLSASSVLDEKTLPRPK